jgi:hypothetical protein
MDFTRESRLQINLDSPAKRAAFLTASLLPIFIYLALATAQFLAAELSVRPTLTSLEWAVRLDPWNDQYRAWLGEYLLSGVRPRIAVPFLNKALDLNPGESKYWLDLANAFHLQGERAEENFALAQAVSVDPKSPETAWAAAMAYTSLGETSLALKQLRVAMEGDPSLQAAALDRCWRLSPDTDYLLRDVLPRDAEVTAQLLDLLISKNETAAAANAWSRLAELQQPVERSFVFRYVQYLIGNHGFAQARIVWNQAAKLAGLAEYQSSTDNLVINGDFRLPLLGTDFDWTYDQTSDATHYLDPTQSPSGHRSLEIIFDSRGLEDAGIRQLISLTSNTRYDFAAYSKTENLLGAGGVRFVVEDFVNGHTWFASDDLKSDGAWTQTKGQFITGPDAQLAVLRIQRFPAGDAIRGKLWIDDVRLTPNPPANEIRP